MMLLVMLLLFLMSTDTEVTGASVLPAQSATVNSKMLQIPCIRQTLDSMLALSSRARNVV